MDTSFYLTTSFLINVFALLACDKGWLSTPGGEKCYKKFSKYQTWEKARINCEKHDAVLLKIESKKENDFILENFVAKERTDFFASSWIGLRFVTKTGRFLWTDDSKADFFNWGADQEIIDRLTREGHTCGSIVNGVLWFGAPFLKGKWLVTECDYEMAYVCQKKK